MRPGHSWISVGTGLCAMLLTMSIAACSTVEIGRNFDAQTFRTRVEPGRTTEAEVQKWLGSPTSIGGQVRASGQHLTRWMYYFGKGRLPRLRGAHLKVLEVEFDEHGIVSAYSWSE
ncbi:MAG: hypothetical protein ACYDDO_07560 [Acidiferrobacterales bacterium]